MNSNIVAWNTQSVLQLFKLSLFSIINESCFPIELFIELALIANALTQDGLAAYAAISASVTFAVVLGARFNPLVDNTGNQQFASKSQVEIVTPESTPRKGPLMIAQEQGSQLAPEPNEIQLQQAQERLNAYLKQHAQDSALGQGRTAMPFARVVNFETTNKNKGN